MYFSFISFPIAYSLSLSLSFSASLLFSLLFVAFLSFHFSFPLSIPYSASVDEEFCGSGAEDRRCLVWARANTYAPPLATLLHSCAVRRGIIEEENESGKLKEEED